MATNRAGAVVHPATIDLSDSRFGRDRPQPTSGSTAGLSQRTGDHLCYLADGVPSFTCAAVDFLRSGLAGRERVVYVADRPVSDLLGDLAPLGDVDHLVAVGHLMIESTVGLYQPGSVFDAVEQVARYRHLIEQSIADGYRGLRVAADATALVTTPQARRAFLGYELAVDRLMAHAPMSAMCGYDVAALGAVAGELCAVHPRDDVPADLAPGFRLYFGPEGLRLAGEVDIANRDLFAFALTAAAACTDERVVVDTSELTFIDVGGVLALFRLSEELLANGRELLLTHPSSAFRRCASALDLGGLLGSAVGPTAVR